jgi:hypothetical protein
VLFGAFACGSGTPADFGELSRAVFGGGDASALDDPGSTDLALPASSAALASARAARVVPAGWPIKFDTKVAIDYNVV